MFDDTQLNKISAIDLNDRYQGLELVVVFFGGEVFGLDKKEDPLISLDNAPDGLMLVIETSANTFDQRGQLGCVLIFLSLIEPRGTL